MTRTKTTVRKSESSSSSYSLSPALSVAGPAPAENMEEEAEDDLDYDVEAIEDARIHPCWVDPATNRKELLQYLVRLAKFPEEPGDPTWEPYTNMAGASDLVAHFCEQHPHKPVPRESIPSPEPRSSSAAPASDNIAVAVPARAPSGKAPMEANPATGLPAPNAVLSRDELPAMADQVDDEIDILLMRLQSGIAYTRMRMSQGLPLMQITRFSVPRHTEEYVPTDTEVAAMMLLQAPSSPAIVVYHSPTHIVFEFGMPNIFLVPEGGAHAVAGPQWWVGKSPAEIKAGPHADEGEIRKAAATLQGLEIKRQNKGGRTKKEEEVDFKLAEGLGRQQAGLKMWDDEDEPEDDVVETEEDFEEDFFDGY